MWEQIASGVRLEGRGTSADRVLGSRVVQSVGVFQQSEDVGAAKAKVFAHEDRRRGSGNSTGGNNKAAGGDVMFSVDDTRLDCFQSSPSSLSETHMHELGRRRSQLQQPSGA